MITLDGYKLDHFGLRLLTGHEHATPATRDKTLVIPGKDGAWDFGSELDVRSFSFPLAFVEENKSALQKRIRTFVSFLFDSKGKTRTFKLTFDYEPEIFYYVRFSGQISPERLFRIGRFELPLTAYDPYAYADFTYKQEGIVTNTRYDSGYYYAYDPNEIFLSSDMYTFSDPISFLEPFHGNYYENPSSFKWTYTKHLSGIHNHSFYDTSFIVEVSGSVVFPRIINQTTGKTLYLPTIKNQKMKVDTGKFTVKINDKNKLTDVEGIEDFLLQSGDNSLLFECSGTPSCTVSYKWKHKFI
ncbi:distal tail protein Dit [Mesobacillus foraminis]|uniref:Putative phage tail component-like protein n=1 Tax=Mesobacillus foraminis TaxID=279826 RepID=A0A4R2BHH6_9BACI|nr:distal tail protein Dit [Mesobacillus foraminis]TCN25479.1 putative phage tail component-like protein [Mesobacillus foraminis]